MRLIVQVLPLPTGPANSLAARARVPVVPQKPDRFTIPVDPTHTFEQIWSQVEARYKRNYLTAEKAANFTIKKIQDAYDCDLDLGDTVGAILGGETDQQKIMIQVHQAAINRDISVLPTSNLRPKEAQKRLLEFQNSSANKRRRVEEQRYGAPLETLHPDMPVQSSEGDIQTESIRRLNNGINHRATRGGRRSRSASSVIIQDSQVNHGDHFFEEHAMSESPQPEASSQQSNPKSTMEHQGSQFPGTNGTGASASPNQFLKPSLPASLLRKKSPVSSHQAVISNQGEDIALYEDDFDDFSGMDGGDDFGVSQDVQAPRLPSNPYSSNASTPEALERAPEVHSRRERLEIEDVYGRILSPEEERTYVRPNRRLTTYGHASRASKNTIKRTVQPRTTSTTVGGSDTTSLSQGTPAHKAGQTAHHTQVPSPISANKLFDLVEGKQRRRSTDDDQTSPGSQQPPTTEGSIAGSALVFNGDDLETPEKPSTLKRPSKTSYKMTTPGAKQPLAGNKTPSQRQQQYAEKRQAKVKDKEEDEKRREASIVRQIKANDFRKHAASMKQLEAAKAAHKISERSLLPPFTPGTSSRVTLSPSSITSKPDYERSTAESQTPGKGEGAILLRFSGTVIRPTSLPISSPLRSPRRRGQSTRPLQSSRSPQSVMQAFADQSVATPQVRGKQIASNTEPLQPSRSSNTPASTAAKRQTTITYPRDKGKGKLIENSPLRESNLVDQAYPALSSKTAGNETLTDSHDKASAAGLNSTARVDQSEPPLVDTDEVTSQPTRQATEGGPSQTSKITKSLHEHLDDHETSQAGNRSPKPSTAASTSATARHNIVQSLKKLDQGSSVVTPAKRGGMKPPNSAASTQNSVRRSVSFDLEAESFEEPKSTTERPPNALEISKNVAASNTTSFTPLSRLSNSFSSQEQPPEDTPSRVSYLAKETAPSLSRSSKTPSQEPISASNTRPGMQRQRPSQVAIPAAKIPDVRAQQERIERQKSMSLSRELSATPATDKEPFNLREPSPPETKRSSQDQVIVPPQVRGKQPSPPKENNSSSTQAIANSQINRKQPSPPKKKHPSPAQGVEQEDDELQISLEIQAAEARKSAEAAAPKVSELANARTIDASDDVVADESAKSDAGDESDALDDVLTPTAPEKRNLVGAIKAGAQGSDESESESESEDESRSESGSESESKSEDEEHKHFTESVKPSSVPVREAARFVSHTPSETASSDDEESDEESSGDDEEEPAKTNTTKSPAQGEEDVEMRDDDDGEPFVELARATTAMIPASTNRDIDMEDAPPSSPPELTVQSSRSSRSSSGSSTDSSDDDDDSTPVPSGKASTDDQSSMELGSPSKSLPPKRTPVPVPPPRAPVRPLVRTRISAPIYPSITEQLTQVRSAPKHPPKALNPANMSLNRLKKGGASLSEDDTDESSEDSSSSGSDSDDGKPPPQKSSFIQRLMRLNR